MNLKVINQSGNPLPEYKTPLAAGFDIQANLEEDVLIDPMGRALINTGLYFELPEGYEAQVRPRSGLAIKHGITLLNTPGTIDADYRGEVKVILVNLSNHQFRVAHGMRIAQIVIAQCEKAHIEEVSEISATERGAGGFGHTGV